MFPRFVLLYNIYRVHYLFPRKLANDNTLLSFFWCTNQIIQTNAAFGLPTYNFIDYRNLETLGNFDIGYRVTKKMFSRPPPHLKHRSVSPKYKLISYNGPVEHVSEIVVSMPYHVGTYTWGFSYRWPLEPSIWTKLFHIDLFLSFLSRVAKKIL